MFVAEEDVVTATRLLFAQLGYRTFYPEAMVTTPVSVSGLDSGVEMIASGSVRFVAICWGRFLVWERILCICFIV